MLTLFLIALILIASMIAGVLFMLLCFLLMCTEIYEDFTKPCAVQKLDNVSKECCSETALKEFTSTKAPRYKMDLKAPRMDFY